MQKVIIQKDESNIVIENVSKVEIDMVFDMFSNEIKITSKDGTQKFKQYEINSMTIEDMREDK